MKFMLAIFPLGLISLTSCAQPAQTSNTSDKSCIALNHYSYRLNEESNTRLFTLYSGENCGSNAVEGQWNISQEIAPMNIWNKYVLFDQGSDENSHELIISTFNGDIVKSVSFVESISIQDNIELFTPTDIEISSENCTNKEQAMEWENFGFVVLIAKKLEITPNLVELRSDESICYALN